MGEHQNIQWFPGHMAKTRRAIAESLALVDAVVEIIDARIPSSSRNPVLADIIKQKPRIIVLNKSDIADPAATDEWIKLYESLGDSAVAVDCKSGSGIKQFGACVNRVLGHKVELNRQRGVNKALRLMVVGIPNVGNSSFINRLADKRAKVEDRPGVTRGNQWFSTKDNFLLLDTPGVLWPKFDDPIVGERLAFTGAVKDTVLDIEELATGLLDTLCDDYQNLIKERRTAAELTRQVCSPGGTTLAGLTAFELLCKIGAKRGMLMRGGETNTERAAVMILDEFRAGKIGRITLERPIMATDDDCI